MNLIVHHATLFERVKIKTPKGLVLTEEVIIDKPKRINKPVEGYDRTKHNGFFCKKCNKPLKHLQRVYCSSSCNIKNNNAIGIRWANHDKTKPDIACDVCKKTFTPIKKTQKFCSRSCADRSQYRRRKNERKTQINTNNIKSQ